MSEARRRQKLYQRGRRRWRESNPDRGYALDERAVYVAPVELRPMLGEEKDRAAAEAAKCL